MGLRFSLKSLLGAGVVALIFTGCGPAINLAEYSQVKLESAAILPSKSELGGQKPKVVVLDIRDSGSAAARQAQAGNSVTTKLDGIISSSKIVEMVDRSAASKLQEEIKLAEMNKKAAYTGPDVADFVISGNISNASGGHRFQEAFTQCDKKGNCYTYPAQCTYSGNLNGLIKVYEIPSLKVVNSIDISGSASSTTEGRCSSNADYSGLITTAGINAAASAKVKLLNFFSPKGYITEKRTKGDNAIFLAQFGTADGVKFNDNVKLYRLETSTNPLTGVTTKQEVFVGEAKVTNQITQNISWIIVDDAKIASTVKLGDYVKIEFKRGFMDSLHDVVNN